jgi:serine/threonine protein kinase/tetratricopeptide (TPR) repeat protein
MSDETLRVSDTWEGTRNEGPGSRIGPFTLLRQIGEGGFGVVFEAAQEQPVKRRVALKIIKLGMDTREVIARFDAERQALAMMEHAHIARVLDAGATDSGRPYFVMELVDGEPIASYCDQHKLSIVERLQLFAQVCAAVQHAHTKGVIHRDLKPSNVLVSTQDGKPLAKVIDFGIAKATSGRLTEQTLATELNQVMGTPLYMSPEQASGSADIDTRTDIYSLGVILYELLTGTTPVDAMTLRSAVFAEIQRIICQVEPPRPSVRLSQAAEALSGIAAQRASESRKLTRMVRGELDWIVMKALEKERARRYETADGLAMDLRRYLAGEMVWAAPPSASYRLRKFVRRNKGAVAAGSLIATSLLIGIIGFSWQARVAQARANELEQVSKFQAEMLGQVDPTEAGKLLTDDVRSKYAAALTNAGVTEAERSGQVTAFATQWQRVNATDVATGLIDRTILKPAVKAIDEQFKNQPAVDAALRQVLAERYGEMGMYAAALPLEQRSLAIRRRVLGEDHPDTLDSMNTMGHLLQDQGKLSDAEPYFREALDRRRRKLGADHPDTLSSMNSMGHLLEDQGKLEEAEPFFREALANRRRVLGNEHRDTLTSVNNLGVLLDLEGKLNEAEGYYRESLEKSRRMLGEEHPDTLDSLINMGALLEEQGKISEAEAFYREALPKYRRVLGEEHPKTLNSISMLGGLLLDEGKLSEAEPYCREALEKRRRVLGEEHPDTLIDIDMMGALLVAQGKQAEAEKLLAPFEAATRKAFTGAESRRVALFLTHLGKARMGLHEFAVAETNFLEAHSIFVQTLGPKDDHTRKCIQEIIDLYTSWNSAEAGNGYDAKAEEWRRKLDALRVASSAPAAQEPTPTAHH